MIAIMKFEYQKENIEMAVNDYHIAIEMMKENNFYEHWLLEFIQRNFSGGTFVDAGANTGNHSVFFNKFCNCKVIAIEPVKESFFMLVNNIWNNINRNGESPAYDDHKMLVYNVAISEKIDKAYMSIPDPKEQSIGGSKLSASGDQRTDITTLDELLKNEQDIKLIKIDVEGHEVQALIGGLETIKKHKPEIFIETFDKFEIIDFMLMSLQIGYELKERYCHAPVYHFSTNENIPVTFKK